MSNQVKSFFGTQPSFQQSPVGGGSTAMSGNFAQGAAFAGQAISAVGSAFIARENAKMRADAARFNKQIAMMQAEDQVGHIRRAARRLQGAQEAAIGASGLAFDGSALEVIADSMQEFDREEIAVRQSAILYGASQDAAAGLAKTNGRIAAASAAMQLSNTALKAADYYG